MILVDKKYCKLNNHQLKDGRFLIREGMLLTLSNEGYGLILRIIELGKDEINKFIGPEEIGILRIGDLAIEVIGLEEKVLMTSIPQREMRLIDEIKRAVSVEEIQYEIYRGID